MYYNLIVLALMIFMHSLADYNVQGCLAKLKQKKYWEESIHESMFKKYKYDYIMALFMHSYVWSVMISIPLLMHIINKNIMLILVVFNVNIIIHMCVDDLKANRYKINLIQDQLLHLLQIFVTWLLLVVF